MLRVMIGTKHDPLHVSTITTFLKCTHTYPGSLACGHYELTEKNTHFVRRCADYAAYAIHQNKLPVTRENILLMRHKSMSVVMYPDDQETYKISTRHKHVEDESDNDGRVHPAV